MLNNKCDVYCAVTTAQPIASSRSVLPSCMAESERNLVSPHVKEPKAIPCDRIIAFATDSYQIFFTWAMGHSAYHACILGVHNYYNVEYYVYTMLWIKITIYFEYPHHIHIIGVHDITLDVQKLRLILFSFFQTKKTIFFLFLNECK